MRKVTEKQKANLRPFKKDDPRINRKGRPKSFDQLRALAQEIAHEKFDDNTTLIEHILNTMAKDKRLMKDFLEYAYGKVPTDINLGGTIDMNIVKKSTVDPDEL